MLGAMTSIRGRLNAIDVLLTLFIVGLGIVMMIADVSDEGASWLAVPLFLPVTLTMLWRRSSPLGALAAAAVAVAVHIALFGTITRCGVYLPLQFFLVFSAAARLGWRGAFVGLALSCAGMTVMLGWDASAGLDALPYASVLVLGVWVVGRIVNTVVVTAELRGARDERARMEVAMDRARLSAELDELLQRRLGELAALADRGIEEEGAAATATLLDIEHGSRRTLEEMRSIVGVLRSDAEVDPTSPQPTLTHLEAMILRAKGAEARLTVEGSPRVLPAGVELSAYRIVEHLLDAIGDAPDVSVRIGFRDDALDIAVAGPTARRGAAAIAIERARERVALHSGTLEAATHGGRAEALAHLPIATAA
jgi:signal transduction histidine kinase